MNDRLCVASGGKEQRELSPQFPLSCFASGNGCDGGDVAETMNEAHSQGGPVQVGFACTRQVRVCTS
jgi:hypothetical protein